MVISSKERTSGNILTICCTKSQGPKSSYKCVQHVKYVMVTEKQSQKLLHETFLGSKEDI